MKLIRIIAAALALLTTFPAVAGPYSNALGNCFTDNTNGKERKELAKWMFVAMAAHPEMRSLSNVTENDQQQASKAVAKLVTRLMSEDCMTQTRAAMKYEGSTALQNAFGMLGKLAMQELMSNSEVNGMIMMYGRYVDQKKIEAAVSSK